MTQAKGETSCFARTYGSILAFMVVALFVKFADLLLTYELEFDPPTLASGLARVWMSLRFSWQEFAVVALLFAALYVWQMRVPSPRRPTRVLLGLVRLALLVGAAVSVAGIKYYGMYHGHMMVTDFTENILWAFQIAASVNPFESSSIRVGALLGAAFLFGTPWVCARLKPDATHRLAIAGLVFSTSMAAVTFAAGRPRLSEAQLEPSPLVWFFWGPYATFVEPPPIETLAPIGPHQRLYEVAERPRNVMLVALESVPARALASYDPSASAGQRLATEYGQSLTIFDHVFAEVPISDSTILSLLTGLSAVPTPRRALEATHGRPTIAEILRERGYHSEFLLTGPRNALIADLVGRGFDQALYMQSRWPNDEQYVRLTWGPDDRVVFDYVDTFLDAQTEDSPPFFLVMYTSNPHYPYESGSIPGLKDSPESRSRHAQLTHHVTELLTDLYSKLEATGLAQSTLVLAFGDHGQAFGEHPGNFVHSKELYAENLHIPMLLLHPTRLGLPSHIAQLGTTLDIMPTVLDILGIPAPPGPGMTLLNEAPDRILFHMTPFGPGVAGFRTAQYFYALSRTGREQLFDRLEDPSEQINIRDQRPDVAAAFRARLNGSPLR